MKDFTNIIGYIYKLTSPNGKIYIGQTINKKQRKYYYNSGNFKQHIKLWNNANFYNWNPADTFEIIEECYCGENRSKLNEREIYWIEYYNSFKNGLNCNEGGNGNLGCVFSTESLKKMSESKIGVKHTEERNRKKSEYTKGRKHTEDSKKKMSENKIKNMTDKVKNKIRVGLIGNNNGIGNKGNAKKIICLTNNIIYDSIKKAAVELNLWETGIVGVCQGKSNNTKGYKFKYYDENEKETCSSYGSWY